MDDSNKLDNKKYSSAYVSTQRELSELSTLYPSRVIALHIIPEQDDAQQHAYTCTEKETLIVNLDKFPNLEQLAMADANVILVGQSTTAKYVSVKNTGYKKYIFDTSHFPNIVMLYITDPYCRGISNYDTRRDRIINSTLTDLTINVSDLLYDDAFTINVSMFSNLSYLALLGNVNYSVSGFAPRVKSVRIRNARNVYDNDAGNENIKKIFPNAEFWKTV